MSTELYHLHVSFKSLTKENNRIKEANKFFTHRNSLLEAQFIEFEKFKVECQTAKDDLLVVLKREELIKKQIDKEQRDNCQMEIWKRFLCKYNQHSRQRDFC